jgi:hypothetical protein
MNSARQAFYQNMSQAFAIKAHGPVEVMHAAADYDEPPLDGIWGKVEFPTIVERRRIRRVTKIDESGKRSDIIWQESEGASTRHLEMRQIRGRDVTKKQFGSYNHPACLASRDYAYYDQINW